MPPPSPCSACSPSAPPPRRRGCPAPRCPVFPATNAWNQRVDRLPVAADSDRIVASIGADDHMHADFGSGPLGGRPDRDPDHGRARLAARRSRVSFEYARRVGQGAVPDPGERRDRGRARRRRRPARADRRPRPLQALRALRALAERGGGWRAGSGAIWDLRSNRLRPAGLDVRRRGRPADPARSRALRGGRARPDRPRAPLHRLPHPARLRLAGAPLRERPHRPEPAADGPPLPPEGELPDRAASRARPGSCCRR